MEFLKRYKKQKTVDKNSRQKKNQRRNMKTLNTEYNKDFVKKYKGVLEEINVKHSRVNRSMMETIIRNKDEILELERESKAIIIHVPLPYKKNDEEEETKKDRINVL